MIAPRYWLVLGAVLWAVSAPGQPPVPAPGQPPGQAPGGPPSTAQKAPSADVPDEEFIEFLGEDDHGDAAWWEFLKKASLGAHNPATPPPQDATQ